MTSLIQPLFDGPLDIVGDVHGEIGALRSLIHQLGYDGDGRHPESRRLVFVVVFEDGLKKAMDLPSWKRGGGIVVHIHPERQDWQRPSEAVTLPSFHVALIGRKVFLEREDAMAAVWESVRPILPVPPQPELDTKVNQATDEGRKTWFLHIFNQDEFRLYVQHLTRVLDNTLRRRLGSGFTNPETDRYFHMSVGNNQGGDPLKSIGSIRPIDMG